MTVISREKGNQTHGVSRRGPGQGSGAQALPPPTGSCALVDASLSTGESASKPGVLDILTLVQNSQKVRFVAEVPTQIPKACGEFLCILFPNLKSYTIIVYLEQS